MSARELNIAGNPIVDNRLPHLKLDIRNVYPETFFLPGDPQRLELFREQADEFRILESNREFVTGVGKYKGVEFGVTSTGIGSGSTEIAVVELSRCGVKNLIRVGGCGVLREEICCGDFVINSGAVRGGGSSRYYAPDNFPGVADPFICTKLAQSAEELGKRFFVGIGYSSDSYYEGQLRQSAEQRTRDFSSEFEKLRMNRIVNFDMESETIFTLSYLLNIKSGSILGVHGNRITDKWLLDYSETQKDAVLIALNVLEKLQTDS